MVGALPLRIQGKAVDGFVVAGQAGDVSQQGHAPSQGPHPWQGHEALLNGAFAGLWNADGLRLSAGSDFEALHQDVGMAQDRSLPARGCKRGQPAGVVVVPVAADDSACSGQVELQGAGIVQEQAGSTGIQEPQLALARLDGQAETVLAAQARLVHGVVGEHGEVDHRPFRTT